MVRALPFEVRLRDHDSIGSQDGKDVIEHFAGRVWLVVILGVVGIVLPLFRLRRFFEDK